MPAGFCNRYRVEESIPVEQRIIGCILGTAIGDAIGLPYEGLSRRRGKKLLGAADRHRLFFGRGMVSDDTEHTCMVAQSLIAAGGDVVAFQRSLAWRLRWWLLTLPAGTGLATLRAILRLWIGIPPQRSGVFSAGNGPAMRAAILGAAFDDPHVLREYVRVSTCMTHTDPKAEFGALAIAIAAQMAGRHSQVLPADYLDRIESLMNRDAAELKDKISRVAAAVNAGISTQEFAESIGLAAGVSGYIYHSVPVAIHAWLSHPRDFRRAIESVVQCGGDTDSNAALVGGIVGATVGKEGIPSEWLTRLMEWPRTAAWMEQLGRQVAAAAQSGRQARPIGLPIAGILMRNLLFLVVVLYHGFRRLAPPY